MLFHWKLTATYKVRILILFISKEATSQRLRNFQKEAGEMAQYLRALATLVEDLGSVPRTHMVAR